MWLTPNFDGILTELKAFPNWVLADNAKVPHHPDGWKASPTDAATWSSFARVRSAYDATKHAGIGYVLDGKPHYSEKYLHGFDWDHCIEGGEIDPTVIAAVNKLNISRLELSTSGTGLRGFFLHDEPLTSRKTKIAGRSVELYSDARYMITTGWAFPGKEILS